MLSNSSVDEAGICSPESVRTKVAAILRAASARGFTDEELGSLTGLKARRIKSYRVEGKEPSLSAALSIFVVLGRESLNSILSLIGYCASPLDEAGQLRLNDLVATGLQGLSTIAAAARDGRIDHIERPACTAAADLIIETVLPLSSAGQAE